MITTTSDSRNAMKPAEPPDIYSSSVTRAAPLAPEARPAAASVVMVPPIGVDEETFTDDGSAL